MARPNVHAHVQQPHCHAGPAYSHLFGSPTQLPHGAEHVAIPHKLNPTHGLIPCGYLVGLNTPLLHGHDQTQAGTLWLPWRAEHAATPKAQQPCCHLGSTLQLTSLTATIHKGNYNAAAPQGWTRHNDTASLPCCQLGSTTTSLTATLPYGLLPHRCPTGLNTTLSHCLTALLPSMLHNYICTSLTATTQASLMWTPTKQKNATMPPHSCVAILANTKLGHLHGPILVQNHNALQAPAYLAFRHGTK